jgi:hypothetical protein
MNTTSLRDDHKAGSAAMLGIVSLSIVLVPSLFTLIQRPYSYEYVLWVYFAFVPVAIVLLGFAYYISAFTDRRPPVRSAGLGNIAGLIAILAFAVFLFANMRSDRMIEPRITNLTASAHVLRPGEAVTVSGEAQDDDGDDLVWRWQVRPSADLMGQGASVTTLRSSLRSASWRVPANARHGLYYVTAAVRDDHRSSRRQILELQVRSNAELPAEPAPQADCEC